MTDFDGEYQRKFLEISKLNEDYHKCVIKIRSSPSVILLGAPLKKRKASKSVVFPQILQETQFDYCKKPRTAAQCQCEKSFEEFERCKQCSDCVLM